jgi:hypothetical protein
MPTCTETLDSISWPCLSFQEVGFVECRFLLLVSAPRVNEKRISSGLICSQHGSRRSMMPADFFRSIVGGATWLLLSSFILFLFSNSNGCCTHQHVQYELYQETYYLLTVGLLPVMLEAGYQVPVPNLVLVPVPCTRYLVPGAGNRYR